MVREESFSSPDRSRTLLSLALPLSVALEARDYDFIVLFLEMCAKHMIRTRTSHTDLRRTSR
jgi:hypothetical protein